MNAKIKLIDDGSAACTVTDCDGNSLGAYYPQEFADRVAASVNLKEAARLVAWAGNQKLRDEILDVIEAAECQDTDKYLVVRRVGSYVSVSVSDSKPVGDARRCQDLLDVFTTPLDARVFALQSGAKAAWFDDSVQSDFRRQIGLGLAGFPLPTA